MAQPMAIPRAHKRGFELMMDKEANKTDDAEFNERVKRQRLTLYKGMTHHEPEYKAGLFYQLGAWICQTHGFHLKHPITGASEECHCSASAFPFDAALSLYGPQSSFGLPYFKIDQSACGSEEESEILAHAIGSQHLAFFIGLIFGASSLMPVVDETSALRCRYCNKCAADDDVYLLTVAEEYKPSCGHPNISSDDVEWATDDRYAQHGLYGSCALPAQPRVRQGSAICLRCLYTEVMVHDSMLMTDLATWYAFDVAAMRNLLAPGVPNVRRLCACQHPSIMGAMCLFRFSRVLIPRRSDYVLASTTHANITAMTNKMVNDGYSELPNPSPLDAGTLTGHSANQPLDISVDSPYAFDAYDPKIHSLFSSGVGFTKRYIDLASSMGNEKAVVSLPKVDSTGENVNHHSFDTGLLDAENVSTFVGLSTFMDKRFGFIINRLDQILTTTNQQQQSQVHSLNTATAMPPPPSRKSVDPVTQPVPPTQQQQHQQQQQQLPTEEQIQNMSAQELYQFMVSQAPAVDAYYLASKRMASLYGDQVIVNHDSASRMPSFCKTCSSYGHPSIKTCPFTTDKKTKPRNKGTRSDHFAGNIKPFASGNKDTLIRMVDKNRYEARTLLTNLQGYFKRHSRSVLASRGGPSARYMGLVQESDSDAQHRRDDDDDDDDGEETTTSKSSSARKRKSLTLLAPSTPFKTLVAIALEDYEMTLDYELFTSMDYLRQARDHWTARKFAAEDLVDLMAWLSEIHTHIPRQMQPKEFFDSHRATVWRSLAYFVHHRNRLVEEHSLDGDEQSFASVLRQRQGGLTGLVVSNTQEQRQAPPALPPVNDPMMVDGITTHGIEDLELPDALLQEHDDH